MEEYERVRRKNIKREKEGRGAGNRKGWGWISEWVERWEMRKRRVCGAERVVGFERGRWGEG